MWLRQGGAFDLLELVVAVGFGFVGLVGIRIRVAASLGVLYLFGSVADSHELLEVELILD